MGGETSNLRQNPPPQIRRRQVPGAPLPHPEPPWDPRGGWGEGRRIWGVFGRFGASGGGGSAGTPPDVACGHLPTPNPPQNRRKTATIGRFHRFGRFSPPKNKKKLTGCVWGGVSWVFFAAPAGPAPARGASESQNGAKKPPKQGLQETVGSQKLVFVPLSPQNGLFQGWKGRGSFGIGCFPPLRKDPKIAFRMRCWQGPPPKLGI